MPPPLQALRLFFEFHRAFSRWRPLPTLHRLDLAGDGRLSLEEFTSPEVREVLQEVGGWRGSLVSSGSGPSVTMRRSSGGWEAAGARWGGGGPRCPGPLPPVCRLGAGEEPGVGGGTLNFTTDEHCDSQEVC